MKQTIQLKESELHRLISESVKRVLRENIDIDNDSYYGGGLPDRYFDNPDDKPQDYGAEDSKYSNELSQIFSGIGDISFDNYKQYETNIGKIFGTIDRCVQDCMAQNIPFNEIKKFVHAEFPNIISFYIRMSRIISDHKYLNL